MATMKAEGFAHTLTHKVRAACVGLAICAPLACSVNAAGGHAGLIGVAPLGTEGIVVRLAERRAALPPLTAVAAQARLRSYGPAGRLQGRAELWIARPDQLRYTLLAPHGAPLVVVACDGATVRAVDMVHARYVQAPATPEAFDALLAPLHPHLDAAGWVALLLGEVQVPADAQVVRDPEGGSSTQVLRWSMPTGLSVWARFDVEAGRLMQLRLERGAQVLMQVDASAHDAYGVPHQLSLCCQGEGTSGATQTEISLLQVRPNATPPPATFWLSRPEGFAEVNTLP